MTLVDLRKLAIRKRSQIRFNLKNGMQCVISETGVARVPDLKSVPDFNLEQEAAQATQFVLEAVTPDGAKASIKTKPVTMSRAELMALNNQSPVSVAAHDDHDDE